MEIVRLGAGSAGEHTLPMTPNTTTLRLIGSCAFGLGTILDCTNFVPNQERSLFHGTPVDPDSMGRLIKPRQAVSSGVNHGPRPAVSTSSTLDFPVIRSLLHDDHSVLTDRELYPLLSRRTDVNGKPYIFTKADALRLLLDNEAHGFVYANHDPPCSAEPFAGREDLAEWRVPEPLHWDWAGRTSVSDLPDSLLVVEASDEQGHMLLDELAQCSDDPLRVGDRIGVPVFEFSEWRQDNL